MDLNTICFTVYATLVSAFALVRLYRIHATRIQLAGYRSQTMCPACGSITARYKPNCLRCGKPMHAS